MLTLPARFAAGILCFAPLFFQRSWRHAEVLLIGAILAPGQRTVSSIPDGYVQGHRITLGKAAALVVDEAQHALTTDAGVNAMFALKTARDALNGDAARGAPRLLLVFTGSHRDKLANLVLRRDQPFYGADISDFPRLGRGCCDAYIAWLNERLAEDNRFEPDDVWEAFRAAGERPELLRKVLEAAAFGEGKAASLKAALRDGALALRRRAWEEFESEFAALTPLQRAVLARLAAAGADFVPFAAASLAAYSAAVGEPVGTSEAQNALDALRQRTLSGGAPAPPTPLRTKRSASGCGCGTRPWMPSRGGAVDRMPRSPYARRIRDPEAAPSRPRWCGLTQIGDFRDECRAHDCTFSVSA